MAKAKRKGRTTKAERDLLAQRKVRQKNNLIAIILIVVALFMALSVYFGISQLWWLANVGKGLLGGSVYLLPPVLIYIAVSVILPQKEDVRVTTSVKVGSGIALLMVVGMAFYLFCAPEYTENLKLSALWTGSVALECGGVLSGLIAVPLIMLISRWGLGIILAAVALFCTLSITDRTMYDLYTWIRNLFSLEKFRRERPEEDDPEEESAKEEAVEVVPPVHIPRPVYPVTNAVDIPIETYEVESDGFDEEQPFAASKETEEQGLAVFEPTVSEQEEDIPLPEEPPIAQAEEVMEQEEEFAIPEPLTGEQESMYVFPPISLLQKPKFTGGTSQDEIDYNSQKLLETLRDFGVEAKMLGASVGPNVTRYELQPKAGTKVSKITGLSDDIALSLAATQVRIEAPIPGKAAVGIEIPNQSGSTVYIRELLDSEDFKNAKGLLTVALGKDISGKNIYADLSKMPHLLVAGTTGSGKSVCINTMLLSLLYRTSPEDVKLVLIDPKMVEFNMYNGIPHLFVPVVTDPKKAAGALKWACSEMDRRYNLLKDLNVRDLDVYNKVVSETKNEEYEPLPKIVVVIDELADLMMVAAKEVEDYICRLCQKARAAGIFLVLATQRPSADVVTGLIKANVPSRIALTVATGVDSRVILDSVGAEKLLGRGDMLYKPIGANKGRRVQGCWVSEEEVEAVTNFIKENAGSVEYDENVIKNIEKMAAPDPSKGGGSVSDDGEDDMLMPAIECVVEAGSCSTSFLQRKLKLGYSRASRIVDMMEEMGIVGPFEGAKPRSVKMTMSELQEMKMKRGTSDE